MVGKRIKEARKRLNMSQNELAEKVGISRTALLRIENSETLNMTAHTAVALANALGITLDYLLCGE